VAKYRGGRCQGTFEISIGSDKKLLHQAMVFFYYRRKSTRRDLRLFG
jgi:hypothetical protein